MEIKDLKSGMMVILRNNDSMYVLAEVEAFYDSFGQRYANYTYYPNGLKSMVDKRYDIMKVYEGKELLWERKEVPKITEDEKIILRNLKKDCKWITRDVVNDIEIYENKPVQMSTGDGYWNGVPYYELYAFNHIFKSITLENSPILIDELLGRQ